LRLRQGGLIPELHRRASRWLAENGFKSEAVDHAFCADDHNLAGQMIEEIAESDWDRARESRLMHWFKRLPADSIDASPKRCIFYARELFKSGYMDEAETRLQTAEQRLASGAAGELETDGLSGRIAVIRAYMSIRAGDPSGAIKSADAALKLLPQGDLNWRSVAATTLGLGYGWGHLAESQQAFSKAMEISRAAGNIHNQIFAGGLLGSVLMRRGRYREAHGLCRRLLDLAIDNGIEQTGIAGSLYLNLGAILSEWNDIDEGIRLINLGIEASEIGRDPVVLASC
jgi:LuxR family maltose regulon positive regulatory protein